MAWHTVAQGEHLIQIAFQYGCLDHNRILDHPENRSLKDQNRNPHVLHPGDRIFIPDQELKEVDVATGAAHRFQLKFKPPAVNVRVIVHDEADQPLANKPYVLTIDGKEIAGHSASDGKVEAPITPTTRDARLVIDGHEIALRIGYLDPIEEDSGVIGRLRNLSYDPGDETAIGPRTVEALKRFQQAHGLEETGSLDDATRTRLKETHLA